MIDIKFLRENPDVVRASQKGRGENVEIVDQIIAADERKRAALTEFETLRQEQNVLSKSVGAAKGDEKTALLANAKELADKVKAADTKRAELEDEANVLAPEARQHRLVRAGERVALALNLAAGGGVDGQDESLIARRDGPRNR